MTTNVVPLKYGVCAVIYTRADLAAQRRAQARETATHTHTQEETR